MRTLIFITEIKQHVKKSDARKLPFVGGRGLITSFVGGRGGGRGGSITFLVGGRGGLISFLVGGRGGLITRGGVVFGSFDRPSSLYLETTSTSIYPDPDFTTA